MTNSGSHFFTLRTTAGLVLFAAGLGVGLVVLSGLLRLAGMLLLLLTMDGDTCLWPSSPLSLLAAP